MIYALFQNNVACCFSGFENLYFLPASSPLQSVKKYPDSPLASGFPLRWASRSPWTSRRHWASRIPWTSCWCQTARRAETSTVASQASRTCTSHRRQASCKASRSTRTPRWRQANVDEKLLDFSSALASGFPLVLGVEKLLDFSPALVSGFPLALGYENPSADLGTGG
jgi:hypothetical protein